MLSNKSAAECFVTNHVPFSYTNGCSCVYIQLLGSGNNCRTDVVCSPEEFKQLDQKTTRGAMSREGLFKNFIFHISHRCLQCTQNSL